MPSDPKHDPGWQWYARRYGSSTQTNPDPLPSARVVDVDRLVAEAVTEERKRILDTLDVQEMWDEVNDAAIANAYATCPYRLKDGSLGAYGPNTCHGGCQEEPECVTGGPFEERDEMEAVRDYVVAIVAAVPPPKEETDAE